MTRKELLEQATKIVCEEREDQYGNPENNFDMIAKLWMDYLGYDIEITSKDVAAMMIMLKLARIRTGTARVDNWVDIAGYAACGAEVEVTALE